MGEHAEKHVRYVQQLMKGEHEAEREVPVERVASFDGKGKEKGKAVREDGESTPPRGWREVPIEAPEVGASGSKEAAGTFGVEELQKALEKGIHL